MGDSVLNEVELDKLKGMAIYWREVLQRDEPHEFIVAQELGQVVQLLGPEKVLHIINEYVENLNDKE